jgi:dTDP-4-amino-4,6-dideoxygalactose transaminase
LSIPFNRAYLTGNETSSIEAVLQSRIFSGNGPFTQRCEQLLQQRTGACRVVLTPSCTDALEMAALLLDIVPGDEVIVPSYTFPSTANAFLLRGAKVVFADSSPDSPNMDVALLEALITPRTKVIVVMHYAGVACAMGTVMTLADKHGLLVVEDAAQAIGATYKGRPLGTIGHLGALSFHATKNIHCGEGGALLINSPALSARAEIVREHGTDRAAFFRGEVPSYGWTGIGSSFHIAELNAAFLLAQLEAMDMIQHKRMALWNAYADGLVDLLANERVKGMNRQDAAEGNGHIFYLECASKNERDALIAHLKVNGVQAAFHYQALHASTFFSNKHDGRPMPNSIRYSKCLLRLPLFVELKANEIMYICENINSFFHDDV